MSLAKTSTRTNNDRDDDDGDIVMSENNYVNNNTVSIQDDDCNDNNLTTINNDHDDGTNITEFVERLEDMARYPEIESVDDWPKEDHVQFLQAFKRYGTDWEKVLQCIPSQNDVEEVKTHAIAYMQNGKLGTAYYDFLKEHQSQSGNDSPSSEIDEEDAITNHCPYLSTSDALASAFLTNRESVREWNLETRRFEANVERYRFEEPLDYTPTSTNSIYSDKLSLLQSNYGELLDKLDIEKQTQLLDEEVKLMKQDSKMKNLTPFERVVARETKEKIEQLIGKPIEDKPIEPPVPVAEIPPSDSNGNLTLVIEPPGASTIPPSGVASNIIPGEATPTTASTQPPPNPELFLKEPNYRNIYAFLGALFEPNRYNVEELGSLLSPQEKEILQILLHNLSITLSTQQFQEEYSTYVHQISSSQLRQQQQPPVEPPSEFTTMDSSEPTQQNSGIVNPFAGQPQQISMLQLLSNEDPTQPSPFLYNTNK